MIVGYLRPDAWDLPLFVHVVGAMVLFGGALASSAFGFAAWSGRAAPVVCAAFQGNGPFTVFSSFFRRPRYAVPAALLAAIADSLM